MIDFRGPPRKSQKSYQNLMINDKKSLSFINQLGKTLISLIGTRAPCASTYLVRADFRSLYARTRTYTHIIMITHTHARVHGDTQSNLPIYLSV